MTEIPRRQQDLHPKTAESLDSQLLIGLSVGAVVIGWGLLMAGLLFIVSQYSASAWLLTVTGLALAHIVLAAACWHHAIKVYDKRKVADSHRHHCRSGPPA